MTQASDPVTSVDLGGMALRAWKKFGWLAQANRHGGYLEVWYHKSDVARTLFAIFFEMQAGGRGTHTIFEHENNYEIFCSWISGGWRFDDQLKQMG